MTENETNYQREEEDQESLSKRGNKYKIDKYHQRYPFCIVWTPIPCISWFLPCIGHTGICESNGIIHDFSGPYYVSIDNMAFGNPTKFVILNLTQREFNDYDKAVESATIKYNKMEYNFFTNNCHSFVANALNKLKYKGRSDYTMVDVWWILCTKSKYLSWGDLIKTYSGFLFIIIFFLVFLKLIKFI